MRPVSTTAGEEREDAGVPTRIADYLDLVQQLPAVTRTDHQRFSKFAAGGHR
jgi:hypothetical protein